MPDAVPSTMCFGLRMGSTSLISSASISAASFSFSLSRASVEDPEADELLALALLGSCRTSALLSEVVVVLPLVDVAALLRDAPLENDEKRRILLPEGKSGVDATRPFSPRRPALRRRVQRPPLYSLPPLWTVLFPQQPVRKAWSVASASKHLALRLLTVT